MCWQELRQGWRYTYATFVDDDVEAEVFLRAADCAAGCAAGCAADPKMVKP